MENNRQLPEIEIGGTLFIVDVRENKLREKANPENELYVFDMHINDDGYSFWYNRQEKNFGPIQIQTPDNILISIKPLVELDPVGMAEKYGISLADLEGKTDYDVMVDQKALELRLAGSLPTIDISGHTFYVDYNMGMLRPKDDFLSKGITFKDMDYCYDEYARRCVVPYDPERHEYREPDYLEIIAVPHDLIAVSLPNPWEMDPVGHSRKSGFDLKECLMEYGIRSTFKAPTVPWEETGIIEDIKRNIARKEKEQLQLRPRGRRL